MTTSYRPADPNELYLIPLCREIRFPSGCCTAEIYISPPYTLVSRVDGIELSVCGKAHRIVHADVEEG